jgi:Conjugative transposon protein TcpC
MVRRSTVERSPRSAEHGLGYEGDADYTAPAGADRSRSARSWGGAGGRWLVWTFRVLAWAILLLIGFRGVVAIVSSEKSPAATPAVTSQPSSSFPVTLADAYALQFGTAYLNYSPGQAGQRASALATFLPAGADTQLGWSGTGTSQLQSEQVAGTDVLDAQHAVVTLLARVNGQLMQLGVPIYAASGALVVSGPPAWLPAPARAVLPSAAPGNTDAAATTQLTTLLRAFFPAYASGNQATLSRFLAPGTTITGLNGAVDFNNLTTVTVPPGGATRHIIASVVWSVPARNASGQAVNRAPSQLDMSYALTVVSRGGTWYVTDISAATAPPGAP